MPRLSPPFTPRASFKLGYKIITPAKGLKMVAKSNALISGGEHFTLKPGISSFILSILNQMEEIEDDFHWLITSDALQLGLHWHLGHCLRRLVKELQWAKAKSQTCLYQSIWDLIILWAGDWPGDPYSRMCFEKACKGAGLKPYSNSQFEFALKIFENGKEQTPDHNCILPWKSETFEHISLQIQFQKVIGGENSFKDVELVVGLGPQPHNDEFPIYATPKHSCSQQAGNDQVPVNATQELGNSILPGNIARNGNGGEGELVRVGWSYSPEDGIETDSDLDGSELIE
ncbi:hypothetical protein M407DRAFT_30938 [Tulasnella calospora MUT 4182]|uniref:Uncharacterized protein n=1 Tax=Tulasnella calospora MUT 4182 TaxID=1051891 RepID=A0A0C3Q7E4_9AGAM|nr:hypothetical protein M407DRAFT_30938 [Tulasnella calospora MUT 4182]